MVEHTEDLRTDPNLSDTGRRLRMQKHGEEMIWSVDNTMTFAINELDAHIAGVKMPKIKTRGELSQASTAREIEARAQLQQMTDADVHAQFHRAVSAGNDVVFYAVLHAPIPLLPDDVIEEGKEKFLQSLDPKMYEEHRLATSLRDQLRELLPVLKREITVHCQSRFREHKVAAPTHQHWPDPILEPKRS